MITCRACDGSNPDGARFCNACGTALVLPHGVEVRRVCTVLFCDLVGFTERSDGMDPEDVRAFLLPYYDLVQAEVARRGGVIDKLFGDGALAVFGASVALEDHAGRAVDAGLRIVEQLPALGLGLQARVGIESGEIVVSAEHGGRGDALTGDTVNIASRIQSVASAATVAVGAMCRQLTADAFEYQPLEPILVKGKSEPVALFQPLSRLLQQSATDRTAFVGRQDELEELVGWFHRCRSTRSPAVVSVVAEPGLGKSRLLRELDRRLTGGGSSRTQTPLVWLEGRCLSYGDGAGFWALSEIVKSFAGILDSDSQTTTAAKLDAVLVGLDDPTRRWLTSRVAPLVGLPAEDTTEPPEQPELFAAWRQFLAVLTARGPAVVVVEDLHWAGAGLVDFLRSCRSELTDVPLLVLVTSRPEVADRHPEWLDPSTVRLEQLPAAAMQELVTTALPEASEQLVDVVIDRAGGSPLFAGQLAALLQDPSDHASDAGLVEVVHGVPATLQGLLAARLDQLGPQLKEIVQDASVVGRQFWDGAVCALSNRDVHDVERDLKDLTRRAFLDPLPTSSISGQTEYAFVHALVRDAAYSELSRRPRADKHRAAARWISGQVGHPLGPVAQVVVHHLDEARGAFEAAGQASEVAAVDEDLIEPLRAAGAYAAASNVAQAAAFHIRALGLVSDDDPRRGEALLAAATCGHTSDQLDPSTAITWLENAIPLLRAAERWDDLGAAIENLASAMYSAHDDVAGARALLAEGVRELTDHPGPGLQRVALLAAVAAATTGGDDLDPLLRLAEAIYGEAGVPEPARLLEARAWSRAREGPTGRKRSLDLMQQAYEQALAAGTLAEAACILNDTALFEQYYTPLRAVETIDEAAALARRTGMDAEFGASVKQGCLWELGRWDDLVVEGRRTMSVLDEVGDAAMGDPVRTYLSVVAVDRGGTWLELLDHDWLSSRTFEGRNPNTALTTAAIMLSGTESGERHAVLEQVDRVLEAGGLVRHSFTCWVTEALLIENELERAQAYRDRWVANETYTHSQQRRVDALLASYRDPRPEVVGEWADLLAESTTAGARLRQTIDGYHLGRVQALLGQPAQARENLMQSRSLCEEMGAERRIARIDAVLAGL